MTAPFSTNQLGPVAVKKLNDLWYRATDGAAAAEASHAAIDNRFYPGTYASAPSTRPNGAVMENGDQYTGADGYTYARIGGAWVNQTASAAASAAAAAAGSNTATTQAALAIAAKNSAEAFAAAAKTDANIKDDTAQGIADTTATANKYFWTPITDGSGLLILWKNVSGTAVEQGRFASAEGVTAAAFEVDKYFGILNLFNPPAVTDGFLLNAGVMSPNGAYWVTDFIPVSNAGYVTFSQTALFLTLPYGVNFFSSSKAYISTPSVPTANVPIAVPAGADYCRASFANTLENPKDTLMIVRGQALPATYMPYGIPVLGSQLDVVAEEARAYSQSARPNSAVNIYDKAVRAEGYLTSADTGILSAYAGYFSTGYMPVTPGGTITIGIASTSLSGWGLAFYTKSRKYVSGLAAPFSAGQVVAVPESAFFVRVSVHNSQADTFIALQGTQTVGPRAAHTLALLSDLPASVWAGRKFAILGDSISANYNWVGAMATNLGATLGLNAALAGRKMADALKTPEGVALTSADFTDINAAILFLGTNDAVVTALGSITDAVSDATFFGQAKNTVETLLTWKPTLRLVITTLLYKSPGATGSAVIGQYSQALRDVAALYALPVLDLNQISGINPVTAATFLGDGLHPSPPGYANCIIPAAQGFFSNCLPRS